MPSTKKPASSKRASFPREASYEKRFVKDWERLSRSGRYNMKQLKEAMMRLIANDAPLGPAWLDHALKGDWSDHRECHTGGDFLLIYTLEGNMVHFVAAGTHPDLFEQTSASRRKQATQAKRHSLGNIFKL